MASWLRQRNRLRICAAAAVALVLPLAAVLWLLGPEPAREAPPPGWRYPGRGQLPLGTDPAALREHGPASCAGCHAAAYADWLGSHHQLANRIIRGPEHLQAFLASPGIYEKDGERFRVHQRGGGFFLEVRDADGTETNYPLVGLFGVDPLYNFLVALPDGRVQATTLAWDVHARELFDTFDGEERLKGDYGHWLGQGLNWNANCAWCHMTDFRKNLDVTDLSYRSEWFAQGVACHQCHPGSIEHGVAARAGDDTILPAKLDITRTLDNCLACHTRRGELTSNRFQPGDVYHDHFLLSLPDQPGLYFPDGQILDEVFGGGSLQLSRMGHAGITCMDCHQPHSLQPLLPVDNNALCQRCHGSGLQDSPVIEPKAHAFHPPLAEGGRCVDCHMPQRTYMARHPRHDHAFPIPDPFLSMELGVPNACSQCHTDKTTEWAAEWVERWYGPGFHERREPVRQRARAFAAAHRGQGDAAAILALLKTEANAAWRAAMTGLLAHVEPTAATLEWLQQAAGDPSPLVRERAAEQLARLNPGSPILDQLLQDDRRSVRISVLQVQPGAARSSPALQADWSDHLAINADRPQFLFILAREALDAGDTAAMEQHLTNAIRLGPNEAEIWRRAAIFRMEAGNARQAGEDLLRALSLEPDNPVLHWSRGLYLAETGNLEGAIGHFRRTLQLDPAYPRGDYNLVVALAQAGRRDEARQHLRAALGRQPGDPGLLQLMRWLESAPR